MTENRPFAGWLRLLTGLAAAAGVLALSACGGGSGAPNNFFKSTMTVLPGAAVAYSGVPTTLEITGGTGPFRAFSSNSGVLPVTQDVNGRTVVLLAANVIADSDVEITIQDLGPLQPVAPTVTAIITVRASTLGNSLTITPNLPDCGTGICSGQTGLASITVLGTQGGALSHAVRFDVIGSAYAIVTNNPAQPLAATLTVLADSAGKASVILQVNAGAPTQFAQLRVTDVTSGQSLVGNFTIVQVTDGEAILTVVPATVTVKGANTSVCSNGFATNYYIFGGTPPYRVASTFPNSVTLNNSIVNTNGGFFQAVTNGSCVDPLVFSIVDATGRQVTAELKNIPGEADAPTAPNLVVTPTTYSQACLGSSFSFAITGGTPSYSVTAGGGTTTVAPTGGGPGIYVVGPLTGPSTTTVLIRDQSTPQKSQTATITCTS